MRFVMWTILGGLALFMLGAPEGQALTVNNTTGEISNWNFTPFGTSTYGNWTNSGISGAETGQNGSTAWAEGNNVAGPPAYDYPTGSGSYQFSPPGTSGEPFDLEFLSWRVINDTQIQVLGITSMHPDNGAMFDGAPINLGDVFIDTDNNGSTGYLGYDVALRAGSWSTGLNDPLHPDDEPFDHTMDAGAYAINDVYDVHGITNDNGYGANSTVAPVMNPFAIREGAEMMAGNVALEIWGDDPGENFNFNTLDGTPYDETSTYILEWTIDIAVLASLLTPVDGDLPFDLSQLSFHWTIQCGNDFIEIPPRENQPVIPEPATIALLGLGLAGIGLIRKRPFARSTRS